MKRQKPLIVAFIAIAAALILNVIYYIGLTLERPVFLTHYYEKEVKPDTIFEFYYITNKSDENKVTNITFPEILGMDIHCVVNDTHTYSVHGNYKLNVVSMHIEENGSKYIPETKVTAAKIFFSNDRIIPVNIGKIVLSKEIEQENPISTLSSTSLNKHVSSVTYKVLEEMKLTEIRSALDAEASNLLTTRIKQTNEVALPYILSKGDTITFDSSFHIGEDDINKYNVYGIVKKLYFETSTGKQYIIPLDNLDYRPNLNTKDIYKILKMQGAI